MLPPCITPEGWLMWIRNCWYVVAWDHEIPPAESPTLFRRVVLGEPLLVYRSSSGEIVALEDRCCHRHAPLSAGRREGDCVRCGYHGLLFDGEGRCVEVPGLASVPPKARVRRYPVVLKNRWVFVWMGEPAGADPALLPDNFSCDHPDWQHRPGYLHYDTPYLLICDNLLDFSHLSYVHEKTLGGSAAIAQAVPTITTVPGARADWPVMGIQVSRRVHDVPAPPYYQRFRHFDSHLDRWFDYQFLLPGTLLMHSGGRPVADAETDLSRAVQLHSCQTLTPETEDTTHYFFQQSHRRGEGDDTITDTIFNSLLQAFNEDRDMITAQHHNLGLRGGGPMLPLAMDAALLQFRRALQARVDGEAASTRDPRPPA
jgi:phenylpropionate dioxygenase-like ring-hydroxylating dioxygenase large terminal subunit